MQTDPVGRSSGMRRVRSVGIWYINANFCRIAFRDNYTADLLIIDELGFHPVRTAEEQ
ncbi:MAG: hypothetical protein AB1798_11725 [Spirochaetota bacterium]